MFRLNRYILILWCLSLCVSALAQSGKQIERYENGQKKSSRNYKNGTPKGTWKTWSEKGQLTEKKHYKEGKLNGWFYRWSSSGVLLERCFYADGKKNGKCYNYHYTGEPDWEKDFVNDSMTTFTVFPKNEVAREWILFDPGKAEIGLEEKAQLDAFLEKAKAQPDYPIRVQGYSDFEENRTVSFDRTKAVHDYFVSQGIPSERMTLLAYESHRPLLIKQEAPQKEKNKNKRCEVYLVSSLEF